MNRNDSLYSRLADEVGDSFYLFERQRFIENISGFVGAFRGCYSDVALAHSYKTNYTPALSRLAKTLGLYAEVVSGLEYNMALRAGYAPDNIIFNGPIKTGLELRDALVGGAMVNVDHLAEVAEVCEIARAHPDNTFSVGIRCNADFGAPVRSRFGMADDSGELATAFMQLRGEPNVSVQGIHIHTSAIRTPESYRKRAEFAVEVVQNYFQDAAPAYINLGGGFPGMMPDEIRSQLGLEQTDFNRYAEAVCAPLGKMADAIGSTPKLILEPGLALFVNVFRFCTKVLAVKQVGERALAILSGGIHTVKPTGHGLNMPMKHYPKNPAPGETRLWDLTGFTCMEHDVLYTGFEGMVGVGDFFVFDQVGAYTTVFKPPFIQSAPPILELEGEDHRVLRQRETLDQILASYEEVDV